MAPLRSSLLAALGALLALACGSEKNRPPPPGISGDAIAPVGCGDLVDATWEGEDLVADGGVVPCTFEGQVCPLRADQATCEAGLPFVQCTPLGWALLCDAVDGG